MIQSETIGKLATSLGQFQKAMPTVHQDAVNPFFQSSYATLAGLVEAAGPLLPEHSLSVSQITESGGAVTTVLMHTSGEYIGGTLELNPKKDDPQGRGSAITYARRYSYASILGLVTDKDDDGTAASKKVAKTEDQQPPVSSEAQSQANIDSFVDKKTDTKFNTKLAKARIVATVMAKSKELNMSFNQAAAENLIRTEIKDAKLATPLKKKADFDMALAMALGTLNELATDKRGE